MSNRRSNPKTNMVCMCVCVCVCVCVYNTSMTDIVEKWRVLTVDLTRTFIYKDKHILVVHNTFINMGWAVCHSSLRKRLINSTFVLRILKSSFIPAATHNLVPFSCIYMRTQNSRGQKEGGNSAWNRKGFSSLWPLDRPNRDRY